MEIISTLESYVIFYEDLKQIIHIRGELTLLRNLRPDIYVTDILKITPLFLEKIGIKGIICDLDNTIIGWDQDDLNEEIIKWFDILKQGDFQICLLSNGLHKRVNTIAEALGVDAIPAALKPRRKSFLKAMDKLQMVKEDIVVIGDQLFTDIWGGKRIGLRTILVRPLREKELYWTRFIRQIEKRVVSHMNLNEILPGIDSKDELK